MPDITMCKDNDCPIREKCYRYTAPPSKYRQSYFMESPREDGKCDYQMEVWKKKDKKP